MSFKPFRFITTIGMQPPLAFLLLLCSSFTSLVYAEGSRELIVSSPLTSSPLTEYRAFLEFSDYTRDGIVRKSIIKVFVNAGEWVYLGSSVYNAALNPLQDIVYRGPGSSGTPQNGNCDVDNTTGQGFINTLLKEKSGPKTSTNPDGYIPCKFQATETGIYEIEFHPPKLYDKAITAGRYPAAKLVNVAFPTDISQGLTVSAWDVTVLKTEDDLSTEQKGRAYTNYLSMSVANAKAQWYSTIYVLTNKGFLYRIQTNGMQPQHFTTFANNKGFTNATGVPLFKSVPTTASANFHDPGAPDNITTNDITHKIFFNPPASDLPNTDTSMVNLPGGKTTWLLSTQPKLPTIDNFAFAGDEKPTPGKAGTSPLTGKFSFNTDTAHGSYILTIDANQNGIYGDANDRSLGDVTVAGNNTISWDGLGGDGKPLPPSASAYDSQLTLSIDDVHFPFLDVENNPNGLIIQRETFIDPSNKGSNTVYYNDTGLLVVGTPPSIISAPQGIDRPLGAQEFRGGFGNGRGIDTWTSVANVANLVGGVLLRKADLTVSKSHSPVNPTTATTSVTYTITVSNNGPSDAKGIKVVDTIPTKVGGTSATWKCVVASPNVCSQLTGTGDINTTVDLNNGASAIFEITGPLTAAEGKSVTNSVTITRPDDVTNPAAKPDVLTETASDIFTVVPVSNNPPTATPLSATTPNDTSVSLPALSATDKDTDGSIKSYTIATLPPAAEGVLYFVRDTTTKPVPVTAGQVLTPTEASTLSFKPNSSFTGVSDFTYTATDNLGSSSSPPATVTITVTPGNQPPVAKDTTTNLITNNNTKVQLTVPSSTPLSATDPDGTVASYTIATLPDKLDGVLYLGNGGSAITEKQLLTPADISNLYFQPVAGFSGNSYFTYTATDNKGLVSNTAVVNIPVNALPVATNDSAVTTPNQAVTLNILSNDSNPNVAGNPTITQNPANGTVAVNPDGTVTYTPNAGFTGTDTFKYQICDTSANCVEATATVTVSDPNVKPTANPDSVTTPAGESVSIPIFTNDTNPNTLTIIDPPDHGTLVIPNPVDGSVTYTPTSGFAGTDTFTYKTCNTKTPTPDCSDPATVTVTVSPLPPVAVNTTTALITNNNTEMPLTVPSPSTPVLEATDTADGGTVTSYTITALPDSGQGVLYVDGQPVITLPTNGQPVTDPSKLSFKPVANFTGNASFTYTATDDKGLVSTPATVTIPVHLPPVAKDTTTDLITNNNTKVQLTTPLLDATDPDGTVDSYTIVTLPASTAGVLYLGNTDTKITLGPLAKDQISNLYFQPVAGFAGNASFTYSATDNNKAVSNVATVTIPVIVPPVAKDDSGQTEKGKSVTIDLLGNDTNLNNVVTGINNPTVTKEPTNGTFVVNNDGKVIYTPKSGFTGDDTFTYQICDKYNNCAEAKVTVTVSDSSPTTPPPTDPATPPSTDPTTPPPTAPNPVTVDNDSATTTMGQPITIPVLANDHNADPSNVFVATPPAHGRVNVNADGTITYIPAPDFSGVDTFTYQACDAQNNCATATVTVNVSDLTSPPITKDDPAATTSGDPVTIPILANDENPNPDNVTIIDPPDHGTVTVNPDLTATYTPEPGFTGTDSFTYQTCNLKDQCDTATATINVTVPASPSKPTLSVTFGGNGSGSVQSTPAGINCDTNTSGCTQEYDLATSVTLTPTPTADSEFVGWGGDSDCNDSNLSMTDDRHCIAYFNLATQPKFTLTVEKTGEGSVTSQPVGVDCGADCGNDFPSNVLVNLTAIPEPGFIFTGWEGDCNGTSSTVSVTMTQARTCVAHFEELPTLSNDIHHLTVTKIGTGNGTVASVLPGIDCGDTCNNAYPHNSQITLTATPDPGTQFVGWSGSCSGTDPTVTVMLDQAKSCIAIFDLIDSVSPPESGYEEMLTVQNQSPFKATIRSDVAGIEILPTSSQGAKSAAHYPLGTVVKLSVTPEPGVKFIGFEGDDDCKDGTVTITQHLNCFPIFEQLHPGIVQFSSPTSTVDEFGNTTTTITVSRKGGCDGKISVDYATFSDTATQPADYSSTSGTLTWEDGDCADKIISIPIRNDGVSEDDETIDILLSHPTGGATLGPSKKATLTILDDESRSTANTSTTTTAPSGCYNFSPCQMCCNSCQAAGGDGDESEIQFKTLILTLYVGQTMTVTVADANGDLLLKELPDQTIASLDNWTPIGKGAGTLTFTGMTVGTTNMLLVDGATPSKMASIHINVIEDDGMTASSEEEKVPGPANSFGVQAILVTLTVGQTVSVTVAGGKGELSIGEIPQPTVASLDAWIPLGATGAGEVTLRGVGVGNTKAVLLDRSNPPQKTVINVKVIPGGDSSTSSQGEGTEGENADGGDANGGDANGGNTDGGNANGGNTNGGNANGGNANGGNANGGDADFSADESGPIPEGTNGPLVWQGKPIAGTDSVLDQDACNHNSWGQDAKGEPIESHACFIGKISTEKGRYRNHQMLSHFDAQTLNLSELIIVDPEHVGQEADILMVGVRTILTDQAKFTRDDQKWSLWDGELSSLLVAQHEDKLPEVLEVPIYDGDLSFAPGEYYVFVGYRLHDGTIVYNGADFIHFYIGNAASIDLNNDSRKTVTSYDVETTAYFEPFIHNGKKGSDTKKGNAILFDNDETAYVSTFVRIDSKHVGQPADILMVAVYEQGDDYVIYTRDAYWWHEWDRRLESLQPTQHYHQLPLTMEIPIYFGKLSEKPGKFTVYIGYRLRDGVIIFNGFDPLQLTVAEAQTVGPRGMRNTVTPPPSHLIHQRYQTVENPFAGQSSVGFTNTLLVTPDLVGQVRDIVMVVTGQDEITAWEDLDKSQVIWEVTLPQVLLKPVMELPAFEGKGMEEYRVYVGYR